MILWFLISLLFSYSSWLWSSDGRTFFIQGARRPTTILPVNSMFGDQVFAERFHFLNIHFAYNIPTDLVSVISTGSGSVTYSSADNLAKLETGGAAGAAMAKLVSLRNLVPAPFVETYLYAIVSFDITNINGVNQWVGMFDDDDGFAFGCSGSNFAILHRRSGVDLVTNQSNFNIDKLDGAGPCRMIIAPNKINLFRISYSWLGAMHILFEVAAPEGSWYPFHAISKISYLAGSALGNPILPASALVSRTSGNSAATMKLISMGMGSLGRRQAIGERNFSAVRNNYAISNNATKPVLTIRNKSTINGKTNRMETQVALASLSSDVNTRFWLTKNPILTGANFSDLDDNSCMEVDQSATAVSGGTQLLSYFNLKGGHENIFLRSNNFNITLLPGESLSVVAAALGSGCNVDVTLNWNEVY